MRKNVNNLIVKYDELIDCATKFIAKNNFIVVPRRCCGATWRVCLHELFLSTQLIRGVYIPS